MNKLKTYNLIISKQVTNLSGIMSDINTVDFGIPG